MSLAPVLLTLMALGLILRVTRPRRIGKYVLSLIFMPVILAVAVAMGRGVYAALSPTGKVVLIACIPFAILFGILYVLPSHVWASIIGDFIYECLKFIFLAPFRLLGRMLSIGRAR